jgi:hypothetical protein
MYQNLKYLNEECSAEKDAEEYLLVVSNGLQGANVLQGEVSVMSVLLIAVKTSVLIISIIRVPIKLLSRPPLVVITTVTIRVSSNFLSRPPLVAITAVARATILPRTTIILYIMKLTARILKPRVYVEPVLNLTVQWATSTYSYCVAC